MSTSCKPGLEVGQIPATRPFPYAELPPPAPNVSVATGPRATAGDWGERSPQSDEVLATREAAAREAGRKEGEAQARAAFDQHLAEIREQIRTALQDFANQRSTYYQQVEAEVVQLALGIARKILRREAQLDPLLLAGMVRVALEKLESGTKVSVRVNPHQVSECRAFFAQHMEPRDVPEVVEDPSLAMDHCLLQTSLGTTELGPEVQIKEIERGLLDLLEQRPPTNA